MYSRAGGGRYIASTKISDIYICSGVRTSRTSSWLAFIVFTFQSGIRPGTRMLDRKFLPQFLSGGVRATNEFPENTDRRRNWEYQQGRPCQRHVLLFRGHALNTFVLRIAGSVFQLQIVSNDPRMDWTYLRSSPRLLALFCMCLRFVSNYEQAIPEPHKFRISRNDYWTLNHSSQFSFAPKLLSLIPVTTIGSS